MSRGRLTDEERPKGERGTPTPSVRQYDINNTSPSAELAKSGRESSVVERAIGTLMNASTDSFYVSVWDLRKFLGILDPLPLYAFHECCSSAAN